MTLDVEEKENLAREAFNLLSKVPESADLRTVCKRFEDLRFVFLSLFSCPSSSLLFQLNISTYFQSLSLESILSESNLSGDCRFYEAVVRLPLQKAQALDPAGDAYNDEIDATIREQALTQRKQCYEIIVSALRSLKGDASHKEFGSPIRSASSQSVLDPASRKKYICQIVQLGVQSPDRIFHEYLYRAMIDLGLENELLEYGGPDLLSFLQTAGLESIQEVPIVSLSLIIHEWLSIKLVIRHQNFDCTFCCMLELERTFPREVFVEFLIKFALFY